MFRRKKKEDKTPKLSEEEIEQMKKAAGLTPSQIKKSEQPIIEAKTEILKEKNTTQYFIGKKEITSEKQTIETKSGQLIELPQETTREIVKTIYQLTQQDLVEIIKGANENSTVHKLALKMLTNEL